MTDADEIPATEYASFNGLGRSPMLWGIPYMVFLAIGSGTLLITMLCLVKFGPAGLMVGLLAIPVLAFIKVISTTDDKAVNILLIEFKWFVIKIMTGTAKYFGGTLTFSPITYGRRNKYVKRYFKKTIGG